MRLRSANQALHPDRNLALEPDSDGKATRIRLLDFHSCTDACLSLVMVRVLSELCGLVWHRSTHGRCA